MWCQIMSSRHPVLFNYHANIYLCVSYCPIIQKRFFHVWSNVENNECVLDVAVAGSIRVPYAEIGANFQQ